jgi:hypothetical protein
LRAEDPLPPTEEGPCSWDDGFPAISADGRLIAIKDYPDDAGRGNPSVRIAFFDTGRSRQVSDVPILLADEIGAGPIEELRARVEQRVASVQHTLDAARFRTLMPLSTVAQGKAIYAVVEEQAVRIVDPATSTVLWQRRLVAPSDPPDTVPQDDDEIFPCGAGSVYGVDLWWDPRAKIVLAALDMVSGCMCPNYADYQVHRMH